MVVTDPRASQATLQKVICHAHDQSSGFIVVCKTVSSRTLQNGFISCDEVSSN